MEADTRMVALLAITSDVCSDERDARCSPTSITHLNTGLDPDEQPRYEQGTGCVLLPGRRNRAAY